MVIISFLYVVTTKVIQHNLEKKTPTYVYYLYKNLENESKLLTKKIINETENGTNTALKEKLEGLNSDSEKMQTILETKDGKTYGKYLADDVNTVGKIDYENGTSEQVTLSEKYKNVKITNTNNMSRSFSYSVDDNGTPNAEYTPKRDIDKMKFASNYCYLLSNNRDSNRNKTLKAGDECMYAPTSTNITNLITPQNENQWYMIKSVENTVKVEGGIPSNLTATVYEDGILANPNIEISTSTSDTNTVIITNTNILNQLKKNSTQSTLNIDTYSLKDKSPLFTSNNGINFHILVAKTDTQQGTVTLNRVYNYTLTEYHQDEICPQTSDITYFSPITKKSFSDVCNYSQCSYNNLNFKVGSGQYRVGCSKIRTTGNNHKGWSLGTWIFNTNCFADSSTCEGRLSNIYCQQLLDEMTDGALNNNQIFYFYEMTNGNMANISLYKPYIKAHNNQAYYKKLYQKNAKNYFKKWEKYFWNIGYDSNTNNTIRVTREKLEGSNINEGSNEYTTDFNYPQNLSNESKYLNHFIYVSIDTPFDKGEIGKNIFAFEQFGDKIIPVGYLANNANTPLKFDVITRNPKTFKIEKVNYKDDTEKRPLTFCEAMIYTGDKFSPYCGCKQVTDNKSPLALRDGYYNWYDPSNWNATLKEKRNSCNNNFGCIIRPVKPSSSGWKK